MKSLPLISIILSRVIHATGNLVGTQIDRELSNDQECLTGVCGLNSRYDDLQEEPDPLQKYYQNRMCSAGGVKGSETSFDEVRSLYQTIEFCHYYDSESDKRDSCLYLNGWQQTCTSFRPHYHEWLVHYPATFINKVERVLFLGGGDNMILHEILKYPSLQLVIGMELDQRVVRSSFKNMGIQPYFNLDAVQWWFGDASKSLEMLPNNYYGTFDLVLIDLQTYVRESLMVGKLNVVDFAMLLLKPNGILVQNEDFVFRSNVDFAKYTVDLELNAIPVLCQQSITVGSDGVDFSRMGQIDHGIDTLVYNQTNGGNFDGWWNYRANNPPESIGGRSSDILMEERVYESRSSKGIMLVLEIENVTRSPQFDDSVSNIRSSTIRALKDSGFTPLTSSSSDPHSLFILMQEGYVMLHSWANYNYIACDISLFYNFDKLSATETKLVTLFGGEGSPSFRIVTSGMKGAHSAPVLNSSLESRKIYKDPSIHPETKQFEGFPDSHMEELLKLMYALIQMPSDPMIAVVCPHQINSCSTLDFLRRSDKLRARKLVPIWSCNSEHPSFSEQKACEEHVLSLLMNVENKIDGIIVDPDVTLEMGQVLHRIFSSWTSRKKLLGEHYVVSAPTFDLSDSWRSALMARFRTQFVKYSPAYHAEISFSTHGTVVLKTNIFSTGDKSFFSHLVHTIEMFENATDLSTKINSVLDGIIEDYVADLEPIKVITDTDYDSGLFLKQWETQHPLALQSVFQFEFTSPKSPLSLGDRVLAKIDDSVFTGTWLMGVIDRNNDDGTYDVLSHDDDEIRGIDRSMIRKWETDKNISVSDKVLLRYDEDEWCQGAVVAVLPDGNYKVHAHDGDGTITIVEKLHIIRQEEEPDQTEEIFVVSPTLLKDVVQHAISAATSDEDIREVTFHSYEDVGDGCIVTAFWSQGKVVATWDGAHHIHLNLQTFFMKQRKHEIFHNVFVERIRQENTPKKVSLVSLDQQPRGFGQVVSFKHELESPAPFHLQK